MSLETRIRTAAQADATLLALLGDGGSPPDFRWYLMQLKQGSLFPAVTMQLVAGSPTYVSNARLLTGWSRYQFTCWDTNSARCQQVESALLNFFDQLNLVGLSGLALYPNLVVMQRAGMQPQSQPPQYWRILDVNIFSDESAP